MNYIDIINKGKFLKFISCCACGLIISSCTTAPITERKQLKIIPESTLNRQAEQIYEKVKKKEKLSDNLDQLNEIKKKSISAYIEYNGPIPVPIEKDAKLGVLNIFLNDELITQHDVFSMEKIKKVNIFSSLIRSINFFVWGDV